jgi:hypothetical protein
MDLDQLIRLADPARGARSRQATVADARQVMDAATRTNEPQDTDATRRPTGWTRVPGIATSIGAIAVVAVVAAVFLLTRTTHGPGTPAPDTHPQSGLSVEQQLVRDLGVLRQPQTAGARAYNHSQLRRSPALMINPKLTREVRLAHGIRVWLYVVTGGDGQRGGLGVNELQHKNGGGECCTTPERLRRPHSPGPLAGSSARNPHQVYVEVVPDGVARVRWTFPSNPSTGQAGQASVGPFAHPLTVNVVVRHNIAAAALPDRWAAQTIIWYDSTGHIIATHSSQ